MAILLAAMMMAALSAADEKAAFIAAGFKLKGQEWQACGDPGSATYRAGLVWAVQDLNGDGPPEAILTERSAACFGQAGTGYWLVSKQANGSWKLITKGIGAVRVLPTRGVGNWPDLEIGGPGFCFPVQRWNGRAYVPNRRSSGGKPCR
jgi:hypothetical protein